MVHDEALQIAQSVRNRIGMALLELGLLLETVATSRLWVGKSQNLNEYIEDLHVPRHLARAAMNVARKLIVEMQLPESALEVLSQANIYSLERACPHISVDTLAEITAALLTLHERDFNAFIEDLSAKTNPDPRPQPTQLDRLVSRFYALPDDQRVDFVNKLRPPTHH